MTKDNKHIDNMLDYGKLPPQAIDLEEAVIGAIMLEKDAFIRINDIIRPECFYKEAHQKIFRVVMDLSNDYKPIDTLTVTEELRQRDELDLVGGAFYITKLVSKISSAAHIEYHARVVYEKFMFREGIRISSEIQGNCYDESLDIGDIIDYVYASFDKLNGIILSGKEVNFREDVQDSMDNYEERLKAKEQGLQVAYTTGIGALNKLIIGWIKTDLIILAARPSIGKTALALHFAKECAKTGVPVDIFSLEMSRLRLTDRMLLSETDINPLNFQAGIKVDWNKLEKAAGKISDLPITINDEMGISINYLKTVIRKRFVQGRLGLVIIDYLQLMSGTDQSTRNNEIGSITKELKILAVKYNFPCIALSQLSRDSEKRNTIKHKLSDLRDSGNIEQDADIILFASRKKYDDEGNELDYSIEENRKFYTDCAKHRNGPLGVVQFYCNEYINRFYEKTHQLEPDDYYSNEKDEAPF